MYIKQINNLKIYKVRGHYIVRTQKLKDVEHFQRLEDAVRFCKRTNKYKQQKKYLVEQKVKVTTGIIIEAPNMTEAKKIAKTLDFADDDLIRTTKVTYDAKLLSKT